MMASFKSLIVNFHAGGDGRDGRCPFPVRILLCVEIYELYNNHTIASFDLVKWFTKGEYIYINQVGVHYGVNI